MTALAAVYEAVYLTLRNDPLWVGRVYPDDVPAGGVRPYVVFFLSGGGDVQLRQGAQSVTVTLTVKCVSETLALSLAGAGRVEALLRNQGRQELGGVAVDGSGWVITTITQGRTIHLVERFEGAKPIYHDGHEYVFVMEK